MNKQKIFASGFIVLGFLFLSFGIAQVLNNDFPAFGRWKTQSFYATLKYFFGPYAAYVTAWIWLVIGVLIICSGIKDLQVKSIDPNVQQESRKKQRHRTTEKLPPTKSQAHVQLQQSSIHFLGVVHRAF